MSETILSVVIAIVFLFLVVLALELRDLRREKDLRIDEYADANATNNTPSDPNQNSQVSFALNSIYRRYRAESAKSDRHYYVQRIIGISTVFIVTAYTVATFDLLGLTKQSFSDVQRAFVFVSSVQVADGTGPNAKRIQLVWQNSGNTPTSDLSIYISGCIRKTEPDKSFKFPEVDGDCNIIKNPEIVKSLLGPKFTIPSIELRLRDEAIPIINQHIGTIYIWGWARYNDVFNPGSVPTKHVTRVCFAVTDFFSEHSSSGDTLRAAYYQCKYGNCADEECKEQGLP